MSKLKPITLWYSVQNGGDGSAYPQFFLSNEEAELDQETEREGWGECCTGTIESFEGSKTHKKAQRNSERLAEKYKEWKEEYGPIEWYENGN